MPIFNLKRFETFAKQNDIEFFDKESGSFKEHWIMPMLKKKDENYVPALICRFFGVSTDASLFELQKNKACPYENCVNPACFDLKVKRNEKKSIMTKFTKEDLIEVAESVDLEELKRVGVNAYLEIFNADLPDILKITKRQLLQAVNYLEITKG